MIMGYNFKNTMIDKSEQLKLKKYEDQWMVPILISWLQRVTIIL